jgi:hypothetical protein
MRFYSLSTLPLAMAIVCLINMAPVVSAAQGDPAAAAKACIEQGEDNNLQEYARCWIVNMMSDEQRRVADCISRNRGLGGTAFCVSGRQLTPAGLRIASCAEQAGGEQRAAAGCIGRLAASADAQRLAACIAANPQNHWGAALCAGGQELTPGQAVFANCAVNTATHPAEMVACVGGRTTLDELRKCLIMGVGADGCFANKAITLIVRESWTDAVGGVAVGPDRPGQVFGGSKSAYNVPASLKPDDDKTPQLAQATPRVTRNPEQAPTGPAAFFGKKLEVNF